MKIKIVFEGGIELIIKTKQKSLVDWVKLNFTNKPYSCHEDFLFNSDKILYITQLSRRNKHVQ